MKPHPITILFADDDQDDLDLMQEVLTEVAPGHVLHYVNHGENVLQSVKEKLPDLVFLDYNLPGCNGAECLKLIKEEPRTTGIPVVIYSTSSARYTLKECYELRAARYMLKPVSYSGIFKGLELILNLYNSGHLLQPPFEDFLIDTYQLS